MSPRYYLGLGQGEVVNNPAVCQVKLGKEKSKKGKTHSKRVPSASSICTRQHGVSKDDESKQMHNEMEGLFQILPKMGRKRREAWPILKNTFKSPRVSVSQSILIH